MLARLTGLAPPAGAWIALRLTDPVASAPAAVFVPPYRAEVAFEVVAGAAGGTAILEASFGGTARATVRVDPAILTRVRQGGRYAQIEREHPPGPDGWVTLEMQLQVEHNALEYVLSFGPCIEVLAPDSLRERVIVAARGTVALYERAASGE